MLSRVAGRGSRPVGARTEGSAFKYAIKIRRSKLSQRFVGTIKAVRLRVEGRDIDFLYVRSIRRYPSGTSVSLDTAAIQVRHRHVRGEITFSVEGISGELTLSWKQVEELRRLSHEQPAAAQEDTLRVPGALRSA